MPFADVSETLSVQGVTSETQVDGVERFWLNGILFGDEVDIGSYQNSSNLTTDQDDNPIILRNVKWVDMFNAEVDVLLPTYYGPSIYGIDTYGGDRSSGAGVNVSLPIPISNCQLHLRIESDIPISITSAQFYAYDGINDVNPFPRINFYAAEGGVSTTWIAANGSSQALHPQNHSAATTHDYFIALSASPTDVGDKQGKIKFIYTYSQS